MPMLSLSHLLAIQAREGDSISGRQAAKSSPACYYYNGTLATYDIPCDLNAPFSACCNSAWPCVTNLHCAYNESAFPGTCTDPGWKDSACPFAQGTLPIPRYYIACLECWHEDISGILREHPANVTSYRQCISNGVR